jgi:hypothetical protein
LVRPWNECCASAATGPGATAVADINTAANNELLNIAAFLFNFFVGRNLLVPARGLQGQHRHLGAVQRRALDGR